MRETTSCARCELTLVRASDNGEWIDLDGLTTCPYGATDEINEHIVRELDEHVPVRVFARDDEANNLLAHLSDVHGIDPNTVDVGDEFSRHEQEHGADNG